jgi:hypothetical protein
MDTESIVIISRQFHRYTLGVHGSRLSHFALGRDDAGRHDMIRTKQAPN